jgi:hypothetical protein
LDTLIARSGQAKWFSVLAYVLFVAQTTLWMAYRDGPAPTTQFNLCELTVSAFTFDISSVSRATTALVLLTFLFTSACAWYQNRFVAISAMLSGLATLAAIAYLVFVAEHALRPSLGTYFTLVITIAITISALNAARTWRPPALDPDRSHYE